MSRKTCPHCGALVDSSRTVCPNCRAVIKEKSSLTPYIIVAGIIGVIILIVAILLLLTAPQPAAQPAPQLTVPPTPAAAEVVSPTCTIAITGRKTPPSTILLQVMTSTCYAGDITELRVMINGEQKGTLSTSPGSSETFTGASGSNNVIVTATFANGAGSVVFQNAAL
jgi:hypothetical protein